MKKKLLLLLLPALMITGKIMALTITKQAGSLETAYVTWQPVANAVSYNVYYSGEGISGQKIDNQLIRQYPDYYRADVPGLKAGNYTLTVKAVNEAGTEFESAVTPVLTVKVQIREGFAFSGNIIPGGYNMDGTVKNGTRIIYVTATNVNTVTCNVNNDKGTPASVTGLTNILAEYGKGYDKTPLIIRMIGLIKGDQITGLKDGNFISFTGSNNSTRTISNITFEGVGDDATAYGYGFCMKRSSAIEIRNVAIMLFGDDAVSLDTDNANIWIHNNDFFYGAPGSDADQVKGDGTIDMKYNSSNITISYNHFWETGKSMGCGGSTETVPTFYVTFHHNWFDHSDSRNPRLHYATAHVYNNYFDGVAKYCIGNTTESSAFVEANYFRNSDRPMMISGQGTDAYDSITGTYTAKGTFSGQDGGMTKAFNNKFENSDRIVYQTEHPTQFDAYLVASREEQIPSSVKSVKGGFAYTNFDTNPDMYPYNPDAPDNVKDIVTAYAGRVDGGDFQWSFDNSIDDASSDVNIPLKTAITNYNSTLIAVQGIENAGGGNEEPGGGDEGGGSEIGEGTGGGICELLGLGTSSGFAIEGATSTGKGSVIVNGTSYNCCLKMGSTSKITFTTTSAMNLTLFFNESDGKTVKIDNGVGTLAVTNGKIYVENLAPGTYNIAKVSGESYLFYISLSKPITTNDNTISTNVSVYFENGMIYNPEDSEIQVYDIMGRIAFSGKGNVDMSNFSRGIYLVRTITDNKTIKVIW